MTEQKILLVSGSRSIDDYNFVADCLNQIYIDYKFDTILEGGADGVDSLAGLYAVGYGFNHLTEYPKWKIYGRVAGFRRNTKMVKKCTKGIAIWDGKSNGTRDTINKLKEAGKLLKVFKYESK